MPFKKGMQKTGGRTKGISNNVSKEIREVSAMLLQGQLEALQDKLPTLKESSGSINTYLTGAMASFNKGLENPLEWN